MIAQKNFSTTFSDGSSLDFCCKIDISAEFSGEPSPTRSMRFRLTFIFIAA